MLCIQLLAVVKSSLLQEYGPDIVLEPFLEAVKELEKVLAISVLVNFGGRLFFIYILGYWCHYVY